MLSSWQVPVSLHAWWPYLITSFCRSTSYSLYSALDLYTYMYIIASCPHIYVHPCILCFPDRICISSKLFLLIYAAMYMNDPLIFLLLLLKEPWSIDLSIPPVLMIYKCLHGEFWMDRSAMQSTIGWMQAAREARTKARLHMNPRCDFYPCCLVAVLVAKANV